jgi:hypothetical protein
MGIGGYFNAGSVGAKHSPDGVALKSMRWWPADRDSALADKLIPGVKDVYMYTCGAGTSSGLSWMMVGARWLAKEATSSSSIPRSRVASPFHIR